MFLSLPESLASFCLQLAWDVREWNNWLEIPIERRLQKAIDQQDDGILATLILGGASPFDRPVPQTADTTILEGVELNLRPLVKNRRFRHVVNILCKFGWNRHHSEYSENQDQCTGIDIIQNGELKDVQCLMSTWPFFLSDSRDCFFHREYPMSLVDIVHNTIRSRHIHVLQWLHTQHDLMSVWREDVFILAIQNGDVAVFESLLHLNPGFHDIVRDLVNRDVVMELIRQGHIEMLQLLMKMKMYDISHLNTGHLLLAFYAGKVEIFQWFQTFMSPLPADEWLNCFENIDIPGKVLYLLKEAVVHIEDVGRFIPSMLRHAVCQGSLDVIIWLSSLDQPQDSQIMFPLSDVFQSKSAEMVEWVFSSTFPILLTPSKDVSACIATNQVSILKLVKDKYGVEFFSQEQQNPLQLALQHHAKPEVIVFLIDLGFITVSSSSCWDDPDLLQDVKVLELLYSRTSFRFCVPQDFDKVLELHSWPVVEFFKNKHPEVGQWSKTWESFFMYFEYGLNRSYCFKAWDQVHQMFPDIINSLHSWQLVANDTVFWYLHFLVERFPIPRPFQHLIIRSVVLHTNVYLARFLFERHAELDTSLILDILQAERAWLLNRDDSGLLLQYIDRYISQKMFNCDSGTL